MTRSNVLPESRSQGPPTGAATAGQAIAPSAASALAFALPLDLAFCVLPHFPGRYSTRTMLAHRYLLRRQRRPDDNAENCSCCPWRILVWCLRIGREGCVFGCTGYQPDTYPLSAYGKRPSRGQPQNVPLQVATGTRRSPSSCFLPCPCLFLCRPSFSYFGRQRQGRCRPR